MSCFYFGASTLTLPMYYPSSRGLLCIIFWLAKYLAVSSPFKWKEHSVVTFSVLTKLQQTCKSDLACFVCLTDRHFPMVFL